MSAAALETEDRGTETAGAAVIAVPPNVAMFLSRREDLVLVIEKDRQRLDATGEKVFDDGKRVAFNDGQLRVPLAPGARVRGTRGEKLDAAELLAFLEDHQLFEDRADGFWRHHEAPPAPTEDEQTAIVILGEEGDLQGLEDLIEAERAGYAREALLKIAEGTRDRVAARLAGE